MSWLLLFSQAFADVIDTVVVYTDRAEIMRTTTGDCTEGIAELQFQTQILLLLQVKKILIKMMMINCQQKWNI